MPLIKHKILKIHSVKKTDCGIEVEVSTVAYCRIHKIRAIFFEEERWEKTKEKGYLML